MREGVRERNGKRQEELTFKDIRGIDFFGVTLLCYGDFVRDLGKVDTGGEIRDAV